MDARLTRRAAVAGVVVSSVAAAGVGPRLRALAQDQEPVPGGTLRLAISEEPDFLDPARTILLLSSNLLNHIHDRLVYIDADGSPQPWLAESWEVSEDGRTITFQIREGVMFTDGTPVDAAAIKANFDRHLDPEVASPRLANLGPLESAEAPDATTLVLNFSEPFAPIFTVLSGLYIYSPTAQETLGDEYGRNPVGSGPFMLSAWDAGTRLLLERNPDYVNHRADDSNSGAAYLDAIEFFVIPESSTQTAAFETGELDLLNPEREEMARVAELPDIEIVSLEQSFNLNFIEFSNFAPYNLEAFRRAVSYAINREQLVDLAYFGNATVHQCPIPIGNAAWDEALCAEYGTSYDPELARQTLADAGWTDEDGDGYVEIDGSADPVVLSTYGPFPVQARSVELMQGDLDAVGIRTEIQVLETPALLAGIESGEIGMDYMRWTYSDQLILSLLFKTPGWTQQLSDADLDALLQVSETTLDPEARIEATRAAMQYILEQNYIVPINSDWVQVAVRANVQNYHWDALATERLIDAWIAAE
ncbi:MAG: ABC transporter substrate-binding protein [Chloroflexota bacterium]|nr:ABC transporter substrate-binding protein [Chloroflexota bacterium]